MTRLEDSSDYEALLELLARDGCERMGPAPGRAGKLALVEM